MNKLAFITQTKLAKGKIKGKKFDRTTIFVKLPAKNDKYNASTVKSTITDSLFQLDKAESLIHDLNSRENFLQSITDGISENHINFLEKISINTHTHATFRLLFGKEVGYSPPKQPLVGTLYGKPLYVDDTIDDFIVRLDFRKPDLKNKARFITNG